MRDQAVPSLVAQNEGVPIHITISNTQAQIKDQGYTYNQANFTYNQAGVAYGGVYQGNQDIVPLLDTAFSEYPSMTVSFDGGNISLSLSQTQALVADQGYTYNQAGFSYNQLGVDYGGVYNTNEDVVAMDLSFVDIYSRFIPPPSNNQSTGPGFFMFITQ